MNQLHKIQLLIHKELQVEWRQRSTFAAILIYIVSTVFISYLSFKKITHVPTWNALFWINMVFAAINAIAKSFMNESHGRQLYYYSLFNPGEIILAKTIYNTLLMLTLSVVSLFFYVLFLGGVDANWPVFILITVLGSAGLAISLTLISAITSKTAQNTALMAILSFPVLIPLLMTTIKASKLAADGIEWAACSQYVLILLALDIIASLMVFILFPHLWKD